LRVLCALCPKDQAQAHEASVPDALEQTNDGDRELMVYDDDF